MAGSTRVFCTRFVCDLLHRFYNDAGDLSSLSVSATCICATIAQPQLVDRRSLHMRLLETQSSAIPAGWRVQAIFGRRMGFREDLGPKILASRMLRQSSLRRGLREVMTWAVGGVHHVNPTGFWPCGSLSQRGAAVRAFGFGKFDPSFRLAPVCPDSCRRNSARDCTRHSWL